MLRLAALLTGLMCFAIVSAQAIAVGLMVARGQLDGQTVATITAALSGEPPTAAPPEMAAPTPPPQTAEERAEARSLRSLELKAQADELRLLSEWIAAREAALAEERTAADAARKAFAAELEALRTRNLDEATEQARAILSAMPPKAATAYLAPLPETEAVRLLRGLPEKTMAKILQEFAAGADEQQRTGRALFEAISAGRPESDLLDAAAPTAQRR